LNPLCACSLGGENRSKEGDKDQARSWHWQTTPGKREVDKQAGKYQCLPESSRSAADLLKFAARKTEREHAITDARLRLRWYKRPELTCDPTPAYQINHDA